MRHVKLMRTKTWLDMSAEEMLLLGVWTPPRGSIRLAGTRCRGQRQVMRLWVWGFSLRLCRPPGCIHHQGDTRPASTQDLSWLSALPSVRSEPRAQCPRNDPLTYHVWARQWGCPSPRSVWGCC